MLWTVSAETLLHWKNLLLISPSQINGIKQQPCVLMMESLINFLVSVQGWVERLASWHDPVQDIAFKRFGVITPCSRHPFAKICNKITLFWACSRYKMWMKLTKSAILVKSDLDPVPPDLGQGSTGLWTLLAPDVLLRGRLVKLKEVEISTLISEVLVLDHVLFLLDYTHNGLC